MSYPIFALRAEYIHEKLGGLALNIAALAVVRIDRALEDETPPTVFLAKRSNRVELGFLGAHVNVPKFAKAVNPRLGERWNDIPEERAFTTANGIRDEFQLWLTTQLGDAAFKREEFVLVTDDGAAMLLEGALSSESKPLSIHELKTLLVGRGRGEKADRLELAAAQPQLPGEAKLPLLAREALVIAKVAEYVMNAPKREATATAASGGTRKKRS